MLHKMRYRLALDIGTTSIGWGLVRLDAGTPPQPTALIRSGVRLFSDGREPARGKGEVGSSLAVGHPFAATGARQALTMANELVRRDAGTALVTQCAAGGLGAALILER